MSVQSYSQQRKANIKITKTSFILSTSIMPSFTYGIASSFFLSLLYFLSKSFSCSIRLVALVIAIVVVPIVPLTLLTNITPLSVLITTLVIPCPVSDTFMFKFLRNVVTSNNIHHTTYIHTYIYMYVYTHTYIHTYIHTLHN